MTNLNLLRAALAVRGTTMGELANAIGISKQALSMKANNHREFTSSEIIRIQKALGLTNAERDSIFFELSVD